MRHLRPLVLVPLLAWSLLSAADPAIGALEAALAGQDQSAKKSALAALADRSVGTDDEVLPLLVRATADRQAHDAAVAALRTRTGLQPAAGRGAGGFPAYPPDDSAGSWAAWLSARTAARAAEEKLKATAKAAEDAKLAAAKAVGKTDAKPEPGEAAAASEPAATPDASAAATTDAPDAPEATAMPGPDPEFGGLDRITFKTGGSLLCYVLGKRLDTEGTLISVRVMHTDQGGEEVLAADLIARIEEEIK